MPLVALSDAIPEGQKLFVGITNTPRDYAWGSRSAISELLGVEPSGSPEAELWLGAHPGSPSRIVDVSQTGGAENLAQWIAADPKLTLGESAVGEPRLPFLLKVLAAASPLSLQAHPTSQQAIAGFAREHAEGIPLDAPDRNYRDAHAKPEIIYALEDGFEALCGFRAIDDVKSAVQRLIELDPAGGESSPLRGWLARLSAGDLRTVFEWLISKGDGVPELIARVVAIAKDHPDEFPDIVLLARTYPGDPGIVISLMLNRVTLARGEALFLAAGNIHAYLDGIGIELMTSSDNVLRGGLTPKHIDVDELLNVLDFTPVSVPYVRPLGDGGVTVFRPAGVGFELVVVTGDAEVPLVGPAIVLCVEGSFGLAGRASSSEVVTGGAVYVTPDEGMIRFAGSGRAFVATVG